MHTQFDPHSQSLRAESELIGGIKEVLLTAFAAYEQAKGATVATRGDPTSGHLALYDNFCDRLGDTRNLCDDGYVDCSDNLDFPRVAMPQFTELGEVEKLEASLKSQKEVCYAYEEEYETCLKFIGLQTNLITWDSITDKKFVFKPIQNEISGVIEKKICKIYNKGEWEARPSDVAVVLVSSTATPGIKYVVDGHHRAFGWMLSKQSGWERDNELPVFEFVFDSKNSKVAAYTIFWHMFYKHQGLFKGYGIPKTKT